MYNEKDKQIRRVCHGSYVVVEPTDHNSKYGIWKGKIIYETTKNHLKIGNIVTYFNKDKMNFPGDLHVITYYEIIYVEENYL